MHEGLIKNFKTSLISGLAEVAGYSTFYDWEITPGHENTVVF
jgi:hypothetical protein